MLSIAINFLLTIHVIVSLLIVLSVLMQRPKNEGLGAAFGGGMTENLFGAQTTNVLQNFTRWLGALFFILTLILSYLYVKKTGTHSTTGQLLRAKTEVPAATPAPAVAPGIPIPGSTQILEEAATPPVKPEAPPATSPALPPTSDLPVPTIPAPAPGDLTPVPPGTNTPAPTAPIPALPAPLPAPEAAPRTSPAPAAEPNTAPPASLDPASAPSADASKTPAEPTPAQTELAK